MHRLNKMEAISHQTGSKQDYAVCGYTKDSQYVAVFDGHGTNKCIEHIRRLDMDNIMETDNPMLTLWQITLQDTFRTGATASIARITGTRIELWSMGDSEMHVFINGNPVYSTEVHTFTNPKEIERTKTLVHRIRDVKAPFPVSETRVENVNSPVGDFITGESLVPSQSLGHNGMTGFAPCMKSIDFMPTDKVRIVGGSDGLFDMLVHVSNGSASQIVAEAERRWRMKWDFFDGTHTHKTDYGGSIDDISCVIWENNVVEFPSLCIPYSLMPFTLDDVREVIEPLAHIRMIEEEIVGDHKVFFIHFNPGKLNDTMRQIYTNLFNGSKVKIWIREKWFWHICLSNKHDYTMKAVGWQFSRYKDGDYYEFAQQQISDKSYYLISTFLN